jgi:hypothetical protein
MNQSTREEVSLGSKGSQVMLPAVKLHLATMCCYRGSIEI